MVQHGTFLKVIDNSGAKQVLCIKVFKGFQKRYGGIGECIKISIKALRLKRRSSSKVKKGSVHNALIVQTKQGVKHKFGDRVAFFKNGVVILSKQYQLLGTRIFGLVPRTLRSTKFMKFLSLASGVVV